ncbi:2,3-bisphosphoglycerate-dependent phosphoglycerate mutase [Candidatus Nasuia deltocephalinicola]|uniref:2,3-bisphosphoglycerate-dependent phosphoglycerate mutase n=1 Tax=Candidatus Nasuia deltocephalincola TaxID=1160784 RepID=UPI00216B1427|nr:2,3-bisphosphoglycerate-dependent phosphoglycerate mutase [Candidatus Nasuia deltocephalinicola]
MENTFRVVLVRHGQSLGNIENRFTGWLDVDLTKKGYILSYEAGIKLKKLKYIFDICYTSLLKRAIKTSWAILDAMGLSHIKIIKNINLNERHYGELSGMNKLEAVVKYGNKNINSWLNIYNKKPPSLKDGDARLLRLKKKYKNKKITKTESLSDLSLRVLKFWNEKIKKKIKKKKKKKKNKKKKNYHNCAQQYIKNIN